MARAKRRSWTATLHLTVVVGEMSRSPGPGSPPNGDELPHLQPHPGVSGDLRKPELQLPSDSGKGPGMSYHPTLTRTAPSPN